MGDQIQVRGRFSTDENGFLVLNLEQAITYISFDRTTAQSFINELSAYISQPPQPRPRPVLRLVQDEAQKVSETTTTSPATDELLLQLKALQEKSKALQEKIEALRPKKE